MKTSKRFTGLIAAPFTPMDHQGKVKLSSIYDYAAKMATANVAGVFVCGTSGEFASLTLSERIDITNEWIKYARSRFKVIVHVGSFSLPDSVTLARQAQIAGADAIASIAPGFYKPRGVEELVSFFEPVAAAAPNLPFYYYHMPTLTGVNLSVKEFLQMAAPRIPNLAGVKFKHNNFMEMASCIELNDGEFEIMNGYDELLLSGLTSGAEAAVGSTINYVPEIYHELMQSFRDGDIKRARKFQLQSIRLVEILIKYGGGVRAGKAIMNLMGFDCGPCRLPVSKFSDQEYSELKQELLELGLLKVLKHQIMTNIYI